MKLVKVPDGDRERRLLLVRTSTGVYALDQACPHEGYGLRQGQLVGDLLTCAWHNWKFDVSTGECVLGEEGVRTHAVEVGADGSLRVELSRADPLHRAATPGWRACARGSCTSASGRCRATWCACCAPTPTPASWCGRRSHYGAPRAEFGWGHAVASAVDCLSMVELYEGDQRALPIVQAIAGIAEAERGRPVNPLPPPLGRLPADPAAAFRAAVEGESVEVGAGAGARGHRGRA